MAGSKLTNQNTCLATARHAPAAAAKSNQGAPKHYLAERGIDLGPENAMLVPKAVSARYTGKAYPGFVVPILADGLLQGAQITLLNAERSAKANTEEDVPIHYEPLVE